ncbi:tetratricopeptide repeat protein [Candidatus Pseudoruminococcus sp.]|uniref:tetratricopeptide repeat protein n=1 Tax=Candidatus Pseudoruminococcus sp. TaxID=3101048 RepID=UPI00399BE3F4
MKIFKHSKKKQNNEPINLHKVKVNDAAGFSGGSKAIVLASTAFIVAALLATAPLIGNNKEDMIYSDIATLAQEKLKANDYGEAIELFKQAIKINPTNEELYIGLADSYSGANENDMARETLETGYIETKSETIKTELKKLEESKPDILPSETSGSSSSENSVESKPQDSSSEKSESTQSSESSTESSQSAETKGIISVKTINDENLRKYSDTEIFKSTAEWFELSSKENLTGVDKVNSSVKEILDRYFKLNPSVYGAEGEDDIYYLVKSKGKRIETRISARVTYNSDYILSYVVDIDIQSPNVADSSSAIELHTIDMRTGKELELSDVISGDESSIKNIVVNAFASEGIEFSDSDYENLKFYLDNDKVVLIGASGKAHISPVKISDNISTKNEETVSSSETR